MITEYLLKKALDHSLELAKRVLRRSGRKLTATKDEIEQSLTYHIRSINNWSAEVSFSDLQRAKQTQNVFLELDLFLYPRRIRVSPDEQINTIALNDIFNDYHGHFILLGQPGAGKTTSMKYFCQRLIHDDFLAERFKFPILIRFRDLNARTQEHQPGILIDELYNILGLRLESINEAGSIARLSIIKEQLVITMLDSLQVLLILDGFDELADFHDRRHALDDIKTLCTNLENSTLILTSRTGEFIYNVENAAPYEICPLGKDQIFQFALRWLNDQNAAVDFLNQVNRSPFADAAIRPLTLAHLCAIYERVGKIPDKPKTVYRKIVHLLLEKWDQERDVRRCSQYASFEVDRKIEFLSHLAYTLTGKFQKTIFSVDDLLQAYKAIHLDYGLVGQEALQVVSELESHTGLFLQSGAESFEFAHKSLQEYLAAEYIVKLPAIPSDLAVISLMPNELAIAVVISSNSSDYLGDLVLTRILGKELTGSQLFQVEDLIQPERLCDALKYNHDSKLIAFMFEQFSPETRTLLDSHRTTDRPTEIVLEALVIELNSLLDNLQLSNYIDVREVEEMQPRFDESQSLFLRRQNRMRLEQAFPEELAKNQVTHRFIKRFLTRLWLEKPDFNRGTKIGLALLLLYSMYIDSKIIRKLIREYDPLLEEMRDSMKLIIKGSPIDIVKEGYRIEAQHEMPDGDNIYAVIRKANISNGLPETLFVRASTWES